MKELQRTVAFRAYNTILNSGTSKSVKTLQADIHNLYFGDVSNPDSIGYAEQLLQGMGAFGPMFEKKEDNGNGRVSLTMKQMYHHMSDKDIIVSMVPSDNGITRSVLASKSLSNLVQLSPRAIWDFAKDVEKNGKKALALVLQSEYSEYVKTGLPPSGKTYDDYLLFIREAMFQELSSSSVIDIEDDDDKSAAASGEDDAAVPDTKSMKESWFFHGFLSFALWGPIVPDGMDEIHKAEAFFPADKKEKYERNSGRKAARDIKNVEDASRSLSSSIRKSPPITSLSAGPSSQYLLAASIAQQKWTSNMMDVNKTIEFKLTTFQNKLMRAEREVDRWKSFITPEVMVDHNNYFFSQFQIANQKFHQAEADLDNFVAEIETIKKQNIHENNVQDIMNDALLQFSENNDNQITPQVKKRKRSETPMSSIEIIMGDKDIDKDDNLSETYDSIARV